ncbi:MAG: cardiolipin synthase [Bacteroidales bacterium]|nr:cardiolipin synthase [Bacteroidales bacterium]
MAWAEFWQVASIALYTANIILVVYVVIKLVLKKSDPIKTLSWVVILISLPYIGLILFFFFGQNYRKKKIFGRKAVQDLKLRKKITLEQIEQYKDTDSILKELLPYKKIILQNLESNYSLLSVDKNISFYFSGKEALEAMLDSIKAAQKHVHLQSFIFEDDNIGIRFKDALIAKAKEGVEVRVMFDSIGSRKTKNKFFKEMIKEGVEVLEFSPVRFMMPTSKINYRNHRKILVVDGKVGFIGGVNIADRYCDGGVYKEWRDTHMKIIGESVFSMQACFLLDRYFIINQHLKRRKKYYPDFEITKPSEDISDTSYYSQVITSGPDSDWASIMQCYFTAISGAQNHIYINTPYLTPTESLLNAIKITALGGVKVSVMLPEKADSKLIHYSTMSYVQDLIKAGVDVYLFKNGFNHSKSISIDGKFCIVGSANMDNRSMNNDFEITSIIYNESCAQTIEKQFEKDILRCTHVSIIKWKNRDWKQKVKESFSRLVSPLL